MTDDAPEQECSVTLFFGPDGEVTHEERVGGRPEFSDLAMKAFANLLIDYLIQKGELILPTVQPATSEAAKPASADPKPPDDPDAFLTVKAVAARLSVSERTVRGLIKSGRLPASRVGRGRGVLRIAPVDLRRYQRESVGD